MSLPSNQFARITHLFSGAVAPTGAAVVYALSIDTGVLPALATAAQAVHDVWEANMLPQQSNAVNLIGTRIKIGPDFNGPTAEVAEVDSGGLAGTAATPQVAYLIKKVTNFGGRINRGRMYVPGIVEADVDQGGVLTAARVTALQGAATAFLAALAGLTWVNNMSIEHSDNSTPTDVASLTVDATVATQRRRLRR